MSDSDNLFMHSLNLLASTLSLVGTALVAYICFQKRALNVSINFIMVLSISDFFYSIANIISAFRPSQGSIGCAVEGFFREFFIKFSVCIATSIAIFHYKTIAADANFQKMRFLIISLIIGAMISLTIACR